VPTQHSVLAMPDLGAEGKYYRHSPEVNFSLTPCPAGLAFTALGEFTRPILTELGYAQAAVDDLIDRGVVAEWRHGDD
jgi:hypothetical protein